MTANFELFLLGATVQRLRRFLVSLGRSPFYFGDKLMQ